MGAPNQRVNIAWITTGPPEERQAEPGEASKINIGFHFAGMKVQNEKTDISVSSKLD